MMKDTNVKTHNEFSELLPEDEEQYQTVAAEYLNLATEDFETAFVLTKKCWYIADRWSEIMANARKLASLHDVNKTDLYAWAYQRYRQMQLAHEHCRAMWRQGKEEIRRAE